MAYFMGHRAMCSQLKYAPRARIRGADKVGLLLTLRPISFRRVRYWPLADIQIRGCQSIRMCGIGES